MTNRDSQPTLPTQGERFRPHPGKRISSWLSIRHGRGIACGQDGLRAAARHARKMRDAEIERLTRERDDAARLYGTKEALDALRDRKTLESERAAWEKRAMEAEADWRRLRVALDNLVGAVGALSDPEDQLSCIPAGPEAEELWQAWKDGEAALSGEQPPSETSERPAHPLDGYCPGKRYIRSKLFQQFLEQDFWHAHHVDLVWRYNGEDVHEEADWLKDVWYALREPEDREPIAEGDARYYQAQSSEKATAYPHNPPDGCLDCLRVERSAH